MGGGGGRSVKRGRGMRSKTWEQREMPGKHCWCALKHGTNAHTAMSWRLIQKWSLQLEEAPAPPQDPTRDKVVKKKEFQGKLIILNDH